MQKHGIRKFKLMIAKKKLKTILFGREECEELTKHIGLGLSGDKGGKLCEGNDCFRLERTYENPRKSYVERINVSGSYGDDGTRVSSVFGSGGAVVFGCWVGLLFSVDTQSFAPKKTRASRPAEGGRGVGPTGTCGGSWGGAGP